LAALCLTGCKHKPEATTTDSPPTTVAAVLPPLPKPTGPLDPKASCVTTQCHTKYQTAAHIHGPVSVGSCKSCHEDDQGGHVYPVSRKGNAVCTFCHAVAGNKAHQHKALEQATPSATQPAGGAANQLTSAVPGGCMTCHDPHISKAKFLLTADTVEGVCVKCHTVQLKKHAHQPFAAGQCTVCHQPHQSEFSNLLRYGDGPAHCFGCHKEKEKAFAELPHVHKASAQQCTTCHGPHATDNAKQLKKPVNDTCLACHTNVGKELASAKVVHGAVTQGNCASCHDPHAANQPNELKARTDKVCMSCHEKAVAASDGRTLPGMGAVLASSNLHGPVKTGSCSECHQPHAADQPNLLKKYFPATFYTTGTFDVKNYALCFSCHDQQMILKPTTTLTNFRDGQRNLHFVHVNRDDKGRTCKTCHEVHGSDLPRHMASAVPFEGGNWAMPINYEQHDNGGSCTPGCHGPKSYNRDTPLPDPATSTAPKGVQP
jgi:predicted CXXCH cytochrome family protein